MDGATRSLIIIFAGNVILRHFVRVNFLFVRCVFDSLDHFGFEGVSFFNQLVHVFRVRGFDIGEALQTSGLPA